MKRVYFVKNKKCYLMLVAVIFLWSKDSDKKSFNLRDVRLITVKNRYVMLAVLQQKMFIPCLNRCRIKKKIVDLLILSIKRRS